MIVRSQLIEKLYQAFAPLHLEVINESPQHGLPETAEKHFRVIIVSTAWEGLTRLDRHRLVNEVLAADLRERVHALSLQAFTPSEWQKKGGQTFSSPACLGGGKKEGLS